MNVSVFGLGYVGTVSAACLAERGHRVVGVDVNETKVQLLSNGKSPIVEAGLAELIARGTENGTLRATTQADDAVRESELSIICVGTPSTPQGGADLSHVFNVCREVGRIIREEPRGHVISIRSTVPPGTLATCRTLLAESGVGNHVSVAANPEFLREGTAVADYDDPPFTLVGSSDPTAVDALRVLYGSLDAPFLTVSEGVAEFVKYASNCWHATKVAFANEVGRLAKHFGVDGREVMEVLTRDTKLNVSPAYLRPGFAYGGSCLPKDVAAILHIARVHAVDIPMLRAVPRSNSAQIALAFDLATRRGRCDVAFLGLAFKSGTDDLRESPAVVFVKQLLGEGFRVRIYDPAVRKANLMGSNLDYIRHTLPHFEDLMADSGSQATAGADLVVVVHNTAEFRDLVGQLPPDVAVLDLAGAWTTAPEGREYHGIAW